MFWRLLNKMEQRKELIRIYLFLDKNGDNPVKRHEKLTELYVEFGVAHVMRRNPDAKEPLTAEEREEEKKKKKKKKERGEKRKKEKNTSSW